MGFDVYGKAPRSERGEYFRNNVWYWRPLATYVLDNVSIPEANETTWFYNNGEEVSAETAEKIATTLRELLDSGEVARYAKRRDKELEALPDEPCEFCKGTGARNDAFVNGKCNACSGKGTRRPWATNYPFEPDNVREFAEFCAESGGFSVH
jgi:hypothetical protein